MVKVKVKSLSGVRLFAAPWTVAYQAPPVHGIFQARVLEWVAISISWYKWKYFMTLIDPFFVNNDYIQYFNISYV